MTADEIADVAAGSCTGRKASRLMREIAARVPGVDRTPQPPATTFPRSGSPRDRAHDVLRYLKRKRCGLPHALRPHRDRRARCARDRDDQPPSDFTVVYHLLSFDRNADIRVKVALDEHDALAADDHRPLAGRELVRARSVGHVRHRASTATRTCARILMPPTWEGHPLRKDHPARATEMGPFQLPDDQAEAEEEALRFDPKTGAWRVSDGRRRLHVPQPRPAASRHPRRAAHRAATATARRSSTRFRTSAIHHRGAEKMGERQTWHTYIPYTDRVDYLGGVMNNLAYLLAVEKLAGIEVPERVKVIRVMMCELFRIASHLVWYGTFAQDLGRAVAGVLHVHRPRAAVRHHRGDLRRAHAPELVPHRRRGAGPARRAGTGWCATSSRICRARLREYDTMVMQNRIFKARTQGRRRAARWTRRSSGASPARTCAPAASSGTSARSARTPATTSSSSTFRRRSTATATTARVVRVEEMRQSLRIIEQCVKQHAAGPVQVRRIR